jgi:hypothetical protein
VFTVGGVFPIPACRIAAWPTAPAFSQDIDATTTLRRSRSIPFSARRTGRRLGKRPVARPPGRLGLVQTGSSPLCGPSARLLRVPKKESLPILRQIFPKNIAGDFTSKWRWVGIRKIKDHFAKKIGAEEFGDLWGRQCASALHLDKSRLCGDGNPTKWSAGWGWLLAGGFAWRRAGPSNALPRRHRHRRRFITRFQPHARMT